MKALCFPWTRPRAERRCGTGWEGTGPFWAGNWTGWPLCWLIGAESWKKRSPGAMGRSARSLRTMPGLLWIFPWRSLFGGSWCCGGRQWSATLILRGSIRRLRTWRQSTKIPGISAAAPCVSWTTRSRHGAMSGSALLPWWMRRMQGKRQSSGSRRMGRPAAHLAGPLISPVPWRNSFRFWNSRASKPWSIIWWQRRIYWRPWSSSRRR